MSKIAHVHKYDIHYNFCDFSKIVILLYAKRPKWGEISKSLPSYFQYLKRVIEFIFLITLSVSQNSKVVGIFAFTIFFVKIIVSELNLWPTKTHFSIWKSSERLVSLTRWPYSSIKEKMNIHIINQILIALGIIFIPSESCS